MSEVIRNSVGVASLRLGVAWRDGLFAAGTWLFAAVLTLALPDVIHWGSTDLFGELLIGGAVVLAIGAFSVHFLGRVGQVATVYGPWLIALGVIFAVWEVATAKSGWLPKPFFSPPQGLLHVYIVDWQRLLYCLLFSLRLWAYGFFSGVTVGFLAGVALGWSPRFAYWGMPVLKLIGPVPATAWIPCLFYVLPTTFGASVVLVALASGIPVAILTASGVGSVNRAYYDVARTLGANQRFQIWKVAVPAALPHVFVGLFMGLYYAFAVLVVAEMLGAKYGLGWYLAFETGYSAYANVYATLVIMSLVCAGIVKLLFVTRDRVLSWQKGLI